MSPATPTRTTSSKVSSRELELAPPRDRFGSGHPSRGARTESLGVAGVRATQEMFTSPRHTGPMRVLIVEDKVKMAGLLRRGLRGEGMTADVAARGEDALWMAGATRYDAVVL